MLSLRPRARRPLAAAVVAVLLSLAACSSPGPPAASPSEDAAPDPAAGAEFLRAWAAGDLPAAAAATTDPAAAADALGEVQDSLEVRSVTPTPGQVQEAGVSADGRPRARLPFTATLSLAGLGNWPYEGVLPLVRAGQEWKVDWSPAVIHPQLTTDTVLARASGETQDPMVLDRNGKPLKTGQPVVDLAIRPDRLKDPAAAYRILAALGRDAERAKKSVASADPTTSVFQIQVREKAFRPLAERARRAGLAATPGKRVISTTATAKPVLDAIEAAAGDGAGGGGGEVRLHPRGKEVDSPGSVLLYRFAPTGPPKPIRSTLDARTQAAADKALAGVPGKAAALVAMDARTGDVLAAASRTENGGSSSFNRAFVGRYPPGSTFKVITAAALLERGLGVDEIVPCPKEIVVSGKTFKNAENFVLGDVPFRTDFAQSCNTAFISKSKDLPEGALPQEAAKFGFGRDWPTGVPTFSGSMREPRDVVAKAANSIGQGTVLASPLAMAGVAASVASGTQVPPRVLATDPSPAPEQLPAGLAPKLRSLMRGVVTQGSAAKLRGLSGNVGAKTGTAEFATSEKPGSHAWLIGYRNNLAFAVLVENGGGGGKDAAPVARRFLDALAG